MHDGSYLWRHKVGLGYFWDDELGIWSNYAAVLVVSLSVMTSKTLISLSLMHCWIPSSEPERFHVIPFAGEAGNCGILYIILYSTFCSRNIRVSLFITSAGRQCSAQDSVSDPYHFDADPGSVPDPT